MPKWTETETNDLWSRVRLCMMQPAIKLIAWFPVPARDNAPVEGDRSGTVIMLLGRSYRCTEIYSGAERKIYILSQITLSMCMSTRLSSPSAYFPTCLLMHPSGIAYLHICWSWKSHYIWTPILLRMYVFFVCIHISINSADQTPSLGNDGAVVSI